MNSPLEEIDPAIQSNSDVKKRSKRIFTVQFTDNSELVLDERKGLGVLWYPDRLEVYEFPNGDGQLTSIIPFTNIFNISITTILPDTETETNSSEITTNDNQTES